ncbi:MAG TPA: asparaginase [Candidatus Baltobacteraceae bacterium]|nr:asparaginase [Candidatus Baltobacteraceae bacterium]
MVVEVTRGDRVESVHHVALCAANADGEVVLQTGDIESPVFLRSTAKPFIAAAAIDAGVREAFGLDQREIAVMSASHVGEPFHVDAVRSLLKKIGLDESALQCGEQEGRPHGSIYNNCSGKHAGILALCRALGSDPATYMAIENPAQQHILTFCARLSGDDPASWPVGIDGCGIPVYATSLRRAAMAFARFASLAQLESRDAMALLVVRDAMISYPEYVHGTAEFDSRLMAAGGGSIACKSGAEGVHGSALIPEGIGLVSKVLDGAARARAPLTMAALGRLGSPLADAADLGGFAAPVVYNRAGRAVGAIRVRSNFAVEEAS